MIPVINAHLRAGEKGPYISLEIQGDIILIQSQNTSRFYATARRLIGTQMLGTITRTQCEPFEFTIPETGEVISLAHNYEFVPEWAEPLGVYFNHSLAVA